MTGGTPLRAEVERDVKGLKKEHYELHSEVLTSLSQTLCTSCWGDFQALWLHSLHCCHHNPQQ